MGRQGCVIKSSATAEKKKTTTKKVMPHNEFMQRIRKSLYFGQDFYESESLGVSKPLAEYASELFSDTHRGHTLNRLSCVEASSVIPATPAALIMALIYLDRINATDPSYVRCITPQELFIVSMMISTKFYAGHDEEIYLSDWAEDGNMSEDRLKELELEFLSAIEWNIYISNEQFFDKLTCIEKTLARREGLRRGWLTYSELMQMLPSFTLAKFLLNNITIMAVSYAASVMTIAGAFFFAAQIPGTSLHRTRTNNNNNTNGNDMLLNDPQIVPLNATMTSQTSNTSVIDNTGRQHNQTSTTLGLNVEDELLKLERQYREEAIRDTIRQRNNEITTESRLTLPQQQFMAKLNVHQKCAKYEGIQQQHGYWFNSKEEYSDYDSRLSYRIIDKDSQHFQSPSLIQHYDDYSDDMLNGIKTPANYKYTNGSMTSLLWNFLSDTVQQHATFMRLPFVWLKFM